MHKRSGINGEVRLGGQKVIPLYSKDYCLPFYSERKGTLAL